MRLILRNHIEDWAATFPAKGHFPILLSDLVRATTPKSTFVEFPSGSAVFIGGFDGITVCNEDTEYVPSGKSLWEFGTTESNTNKANRDYAKRKTNTLGHNPSECTYIFVTPTVWAEKDTWRTEKLNDRFWKDVKAYDSRNLEDWLELTPVVARRFGKDLINLPQDGILLIDDFWDEWATGPKGLKLSTNITFKGREKQASELLDFLSSDPGMMAVRAPSKDEAIAFIVSAAKQFDKNNSDYFFSKSLIVESFNGFRYVADNRNSLNIIAKVEERGKLHFGVSKGHHVLVPLGPDDSYNSNDIIDLPNPEKDNLVLSLSEIGFEKDLAADLARESGRNITILKRLLKFEYKFNIGEEKNIEEILPAMLLGRWDENKKGDIELLETLSNEKYDVYRSKILKWKNSQGNLFLQIGSMWRLTSPMDAWTNLSSFLSKTHLDSLKSCILNVLSQNNPSLDIDPNERYMASLLGKVSEYSAWAREGLIQSLILIGLYGKHFNIYGITNPQEWVDEIVKTLLYNAEGKLWASLNYEMPLLAEASPDGFLSSVNNSLNSNQNHILEMFAEEKSLITPRSRHTGLLWAMESLAWMPEYLSNASLTLARLAMIDPGGSLSNRPINSLIEIFKPWHFQTLANLDQRMEVLKLVSARHPKIAWELLFNLLPKQTGETGHYTHRFRWRMFGMSSKKVVNNNEVFKAPTAIIEIILSLFDYSEEKLASIIKHSDVISPWDRKRVLSFVESNYSKVKKEKYLHWDEIRKILYYQNSHPNSDISLSSEELQKYQDLYIATKPEDEIMESLWLFNEHWPHFPEGYIYENTPTEKQHELITQKRVEALWKIYKKNGIQTVYKLKDKISEKAAYGDALAAIIEDDKEIIYLLNDLYQSKKDMNFSNGLIFKKVYLNGVKWALDFYGKLQENGFSNFMLANFLLPIRPSKELWDFVAQTDPEVQSSYWTNVNSNFHYLSADEKILGIQQLIKHNRFLSAVNSSLYSLEDIPTALIVELLVKLVTIPSIEIEDLQGYEIGRLFDELDSRKDVDETDLFQLEWFYIHILSSYSTSRKPTLLLKQINIQPKFFVDLMQWLYLPKNRDLIETERAGLKDEEIDIRAKKAYELLKGIKTIPGVDENGKLDADYLNKWIDDVREEAAKVSREEVTDMSIAKILTKYPENDPDWPIEKIFEIIERINTDSIKRNFYSELFNKRGQSSRLAFAGGDIERGHAAYFESLHNKYVNIYPNVAQIFKDLSNGYIQDAKRMDDSAERDRLDY